MSRPSRKRIAHPMQPVLLPRVGHAHFKPNRVVQHLRYLAREAGVTLDHLEQLPGLKPEDFEQFLQLMGYTIVGYGELSVVRKSSKKSAEAAEVKARRQAKTRSRAIVGS